MTVQRRSLSRFAVGMIVPALLLAIWQVLLSAQLLPSSQAASPADIVSSLVSLLRSGILLKYSYYSILRLAIGVCIGTLLAVAFALAISVSSRISTLLLPMTQLLAGVPVVLWMPFCVMLFGVGEVYKVSLVAVGTFFLVQVFVLQSLRDVERQFVELADIYGKTRSVRVAHLFLPASLPAMFTSLRAAFAAGWIVLFFVEFAASSAGEEGLGWFIADARHAGRIEQEFAGLLWLGTLALVLDVCIARLQTSRLKWVDKFANGV
jgi:sulfonate transport system permease protein